jgi:hypothetical protein
MGLQNSKEIVTTTTTASNPNDEKVDDDFEIEVVVDAFMPTVATTSTAGTSSSIASVHHHKSLIPSSESSSSTITMTVNVNARCAVYFDSYDDFFDRKDESLHSSKKGHWFLGTIIEIQEQPDAASSSSSSSSFKSKRRGRGRSKKQSISDMVRISPTLTSATAMEKSTDAVVTVQFDDKSIETDIPLRDIRVLTPFTMPNHKVTETDPPQYLCFDNSSDQFLPHQQEFERSLSPSLLIMNEDDCIITTSSPDIANRIFCNLQPATLLLGDLVQVLFQNGAAQNAWYRGRVCRVHVTTKNEVTRYYADIVYDDGDIECNVPYNVKSHASQSELSDSNVIVLLERGYVDTAWLDGLSVPLSSAMFATKRRNDLNYFRMGTVQVVNEHPTTQIANIDEALLPVCCYLQSGCTTIEQCPYIETVTAVFNYEIHQKKKSKHKHTKYDWPSLPSNPTNNCTQTLPSLPPTVHTTVISIEDTTRTTHCKKNSSKQALHQPISSDRVNVKTSSSLPLQRQLRSRSKKYEVILVDDSSAVDDSDYGDEIDPIIPGVDSNTGKLKSSSSVRGRLRHRGTVQSYKEEVTSSSSDLDSSDDEDEENDPSVKVVKRLSETPTNNSTQKLKNIMKDINNDTRKLDIDNEAVTKSTRCNTTSNVVARTRKALAKTNTTAKRRATATEHVVPDGINKKTNVAVVSVQQQKSKRRKTVNHIDETDETAVLETQWNWERMVSTTTPSTDSPSNQHSHKVMDNSISNPLGKAMNSCDAIVAADLLTFMAGMHGTLHRCLVSFLDLFLHKLTVSVSFNDSVKNNCFIFGFTRMTISNRSDTKR